MLGSSIYIILIVAMLASIVGLIKNEITYKNHMIITEAILVYNIDMIKNDSDSRINFEEAEDYATTFWRLWDWGYTRILPRDKFELVKPYIGKEK